MGLKLNNLFRRKVIFYPPVIWLNLGLPTFGLKNDVLPTWVHFVNVCQLSPFKTCMWMSRASRESNTCRFRKSDSVLEKWYFTHLCFSWLLVAQLYLTLQFNEHYEDLTWVITHLLNCTVANQTNNVPLLVILRPIFVFGFGFWLKPVCFTSNFLVDVKSISPSSFL